MTVLFYRRFSLAWSSLHAVREILLTFMTRLAINSDDIDNSGLVITEYLTNLIRHSEGEDASITLVLSRSVDCFEIKLIDPTSYYDLKKDRLSEEALTDGALREGGMGLALITHYFPEFKYECKENLNHFSFNVPLNKSKPRVVIIDDEPATLALLAAYLNDKYDCVTFSCEQAAYEYLRFNIATLLIIDLNLNVMLGTEFIDSIKSFEHLNYLGIVVVSADGSEQSMQNANYTGVDDYLVKPVTKSRLKCVCERVLQRCLTVGVVKSDKQTQKQNKQTFGELKVSAFGNCVGDKGGDFLFQHTAFCHPVLFFGDIMGHGEHANRIRSSLDAFIAGFCCGEFKHFKHFTTQFFNKLAEQAFLECHIVTLIVFTVDGRQVQWVNLGHPPPLVWQEQQILTQVGLTQPLLGLSTQQEFQVDSIELSENTHLIIATDGIIENNSHEQELISFLNQRLMQSKHSRSDASTLWQKCLPSLSKAIDDYSLVVLN